MQKYSVYAVVIICIIIIPDSLITSQLFIMAGVAQTRLKGAKKWSKDDSCICTSSQEAK